MATNTWQNGSTYNDRYYNAFSYDANGNILTQVRHNVAGTRVENLSYKYERNANGHLLRNRLYHVNETVAAGTFSDDIDDQGTFTTSNINVNNNYGYDEEGRLIRDDAEDIAQIKWTVTSKVKEVIRTNGSPKKNLKFDYDASGKRIAKHVYTSSNVWEKSTYYTYDATGNVMAVYEKENPGAGITFTVAERHIYGSSRVGMNTTKAELTATTALPDTGNFVHAIGKKQFELSNHLGNVLSSITDKLIAKDWNNDQTVDSYKAEILFSQDYTPFGVKMDGRTFANSYRYSFNGKETDDETGIQDYGFRMYNVLLGRFLSVDPLTQSYPWYTPYQFAGNKPIIAIDLDGLEEYIVTNIYDVNGKLISSTIDFRTDANGIINQNYTSADKVNHSCNQVMVNNRYKQADGTYRNEYSYQDALTKEQYDATQNATATDLVQYTTLGGEKYKNVKAWQANIPLPPPPPAPKYKPGQIITLDNAQTYTLVSTTGVTGGSSLNDINKPAYDGELSPDGRKYYQKLGRDIGKNPGAVTQINVTLHYEVGNNYTGTWPPAGITLGGPTAAKEVNQYIRKGLEGANVKINVTFDYKTVNNGGYGVTAAGATIQIQ